MDVNVQVGSWYVVEGDAGDTVTNPSTGKVIATVEEGKQTGFLATTPYVITSADTVGVHKANFKCASVKLRLLGLLGRGVDALPKGYLAAEFLETNGSQYVDIPITCGYDAEVEMTANVLPQTFANTPGLFSNEGLSGFFSANRISLLFYKDHHVRADFGEPSSTGRFPGLIIGSTRKYKLNKKGLYIDDTLRISLTTSEFSGTTTRFFARKWTPISARFYTASIKTPLQKAAFVPAVDALGVPCLYDTKSKQPFFNSGSSPFVVGMTCAQARKLGKLPEGGGEITVSLPWDAQLDKKVDAALSEAKAKGWTIVVQYQEPDTTSAVYNKYAACTTRADLDAVDPNWRLDLTSDGSWIYPLPEMTRLAGMWTMDTGFPKNVLKRAVLNSPKATTATELFYGEKAIEYAEVYAPLATSCNWFAWKADNLKEVHFTGDNATLGVDAFAGCHALSKFYGTLLKLSDAPGMFSYCQFDKESTLRILNSIPAHKSGNHQLSIGIHVDHQNDEEVLAAIALADIAQTPIADGGKGWSLSVQWRGTATAQTASTFGLRRQPIYAKVREAETPEGTTERVLDWGHYVTNWEENGYQEFASVEEAEEYFNINQTEEV